VRPRSGYEELARRLLGGVNLVGDLREALEVSTETTTPG